MIKKITKINKGPAPYQAKGFGSGFVLLYSVMLVSIILAVAIGMANIAFKEVAFTTSARESNNAFYAADTGAECALFHDKLGGNFFPFEGPGVDINCNNTVINPNFSGTPISADYDFVLTGLGNNNSCAKVTINKTRILPTDPIDITIESRGYNFSNPTCTTVGVSNAIERAVRMTTNEVPLGNSASFVGTDASTQGSWHGVYGADGYNVVGGTEDYPSYATVTFPDFPAPSYYTWGPTSEVRAPYESDSSTNRVASVWYYPTPWTIDINFSDTGTHQVAFYLLDFDTANTRAQTMEVYDADTSDLLSTQSVSNYSNGKYLKWSISGHVYFRIITDGGINSVVSGIFFR